MGTGGRQLRKQHAAATRRPSITVISKAEYQWKATIPVSPDTQYCYRVMLGTTDLLGSATLRPRSRRRCHGSTTPFSFAVFGDWGQAYAGGVNADQTNVLAPDRRERRTIRRDDR